MPQSLVKIYVHAVFSTKERRAYLQKESLRHRMHAYLTGACERIGCKPMQVDGPEDHVHLLFGLDKTMDIAKFIREVKRESSKWIKTQDPEAGVFRWQSGYGAFSISPAHCRSLTEYIRNQETHHKEESFQDEFRRLCKKYGLELDERYAWD